MKRKTAVKKLMVALDRNTANWYLDSAHRVCDLTNYGAILAYIYLQIETMMNKGKITEEAGRKAIENLWRSN